MTFHLLSAERIFDGSAAVPNTSVQIVDAIITAVGDDRAAPPGSAARHHFPGCTILPGLIDTHVHLVFAALDTNPAVVQQVARETDEQLLARAVTNAGAALRAGVTTVRDCGGRGNVVQRARDLIRKGAADGADILSCGMPITTTTGHCHWLGVAMN